MNKNIALTPPMGWNSWDCYGAGVREEQVRGNADYMEKYLKEHGWEYVVVDIQWYEPTADSTQYHPYAPLDMDEYGRLIPAVNRFPSTGDGQGFKVLAEYVHNKGLKFGIHILRGIPKQAVKANTPILGSDKFAIDIADISSTCPWNTDMYGIDSSKEGSQEYYQSIISMYADWGVDYIKVDDISFPYSSGEVEQIQNAIMNTGRDIILSLSPGPAQLENAEHLKRYSNMWRISDDFWDKWLLLYAQFERLDKWNPHMGEGHWPDADMLPFGHISIGEKWTENCKGKWTGFTQTEQVTLMSLWCMARSPLMFGGEMTYNDQWTLDLITNDEVLSILKDSHSNRQLYRKDDKVVWTAQNSKGEAYVAMFNLTEEAAVVEVELSELNLTGGSLIRDLWLHTDLGTVTGTLSKEIQPHGSVLYKLTK